MTAAEVNAERIETIIRKHYHLRPKGIARKIVEAIPELRPAQQEFLADGNTRTIAAPLPWSRP